MGYILLFFMVIVIIAFSYNFINHHKEMTDAVICTLCHKEIDSPEDKLEYEPHSTVSKKKYYHKSCALKLDFIDPENIIKWEDHWKYPDTSNTPLASDYYIEPTPIFALRAVSWLNLIAGIVGAILIWSSMGTVETRFSSEMNPLGVGLGIYVLTAGIVGWALFQVICLIAVNLIEIRKSLSSNHLH